jgi:hypothetical protein
VLPFLFKRGNTNMSQIDSFKILAAIGKVQENEELYEAVNSTVVRIGATPDANKVVDLNTYRGANEVSQLLNRAYNDGKRVALQELARELTTTPRDWLEKKEA